MSTLFEKPDQCEHPRESRTGLARLPQKPLTASCTPVRVHTYIAEYLECPSITWSTQTPSRKQYSMHTTSLNCLLTDANETSRVDWGRAVQRQKWQRVTTDSKYFLAMSVRSPFCSNNVCGSCSVDWPQTCLWTFSHNPRSTGYDFALAASHGDAATEEALTNDTYFRFRRQFKRRTGILIWFPSACNTSSEASKRFIFPLWVTLSPISHWYDPAKTKCLISTERPSGPVSAIVIDLIMFQVGLKRSTLPYCDLRHAANSPCTASCSTSQHGKICGDSKQSLV